MTEELETEASVEPEGGSPESQPPQDADDASYGRRVRKRIDTLTARVRQTEQRASTAEQKYASAEARAIAAEAELAKLSVQQAKEAAKAAHTAGDIDAQVAASEQLARASQRLAVAEAARPTPQPQPQPGYTDRTQQWMDENPWFNTDAAAKALALRAHGEALAKGLVGDSEEYWGFIDGRVKAKFPHHYADDGAEPEPEPEPPARRDAAPVAPARRAAVAPGGQKAVKLPSLTAAELEACKITGQTPQEYAAEKLRLQKEGR